MSDPFADELERARTLYGLVDAGLSLGLAEKVMQLADAGYDVHEATLRIEFADAIEQGTAESYFIEAKALGEPPPFFACPSCGPGDLGRRLELSEDIAFPDPAPEVLISCPWCYKRFRVPYWTLATTAHELTEGDEWYPKRILLGPEHCFTHSELQRAHEERDIARIEAEREANPDHDQPLDEEEQT